MRFHVAAHRYGLRITPGRLIHEGRHSLGAVVRAEREIILSADCPARDRLRVLLRELLRAWVMETGQPSSAEGWLDLASTATAAAINDLCAQGGELALTNLQPGESPSPGAARAGVGTSRQCAKCSGAVVGASVAWRPVANGVAELRLFCEFCGVTMIWQEATNARGFPGAITLGQPRFERGDTAGISIGAESA